MDVNAIVSSHLKRATDKAAGIPTTDRDFQVKNILDTNKALRGELSAKDALGFEADDAIIKRVRDAYQEKVKADYDLNTDQQRMAQGKLPTSYDKKYDNTARDIWLYNNGLPSAGEFIEYYNKELEKVRKDELPDLQYETLVRSAADKFYGGGKYNEASVLEYIQKTLETLPELKDKVLSSSKPRTSEITYDNPVDEAFANYLDENKQKKNYSFEQMISDIKGIIYSRTSRERLIKNGSYKTRTAPQSVPEAGTVDNTTTTPNEATQDAQPAETDEEKAARVARYKAVGGDPDVMEAQRQQWIDAAAKYKREKTDSAAKRAAEAELDAERDKMVGSNAQMKDTKIGAVQLGLAKDDPKFGGEDLTQKSETATKAEIETFRAEAKASGKTGLEIDNSLRRGGLKPYLSADEETQNYFIELSGEAGIPEEQAKQRFESLSDTERAKYYADMAFDNRVHNFVGEEVIRSTFSIPVRAAIDIVSNTVGFADSMIGSDTEMWDVTKKLMETSYKARQYGTSENHAFLNIVNDVGTEIVKMYALNAAGRFAAANLGTGAQIGLSLPQKGIGLIQNYVLKAMNYGLQSAPFISNAWGGYYMQAKSQGASRQEATEFAFYAGTFEGLVEAFTIGETFDKIVSSRIAKRVLPGTKNFLSTYGPGAIAIGTAALGEGVEEGLSYTVSGLLEKSIYNPQWAFDKKEFWDQVGMGALVGGVGSAATFPIGSRPNQILENMIEEGYTPEKLDALWAAMEVEGMSADKVETRTAEAQVLPIEEYRQAVADETKSAQAIDNAKLNYDKQIAANTEKVTQSNNRIKAIQTKIAALDQNSKSFAKDMENYGNQLADALRAHSKLTADVEGANENARKEKDSVTANNTRVKESAKRKLDDHYIAYDEADKKAEYEAVFNSHIDRRDAKSVGNRHMKAFSFEHPEVRENIKEMAQVFLVDLTEGTRGERYAIFDATSYTGNAIEGFGGTKRVQTNEITEMIESGMTYAQIEDGLKRIIAGEGTENSANAKRVELYLDKALTEGYETLSYGKIEPNISYVMAKSNIPGGKPNKLFDEKTIDFMNEVNRRKYMGESMDGLDLLAEDEVADAEVDIDAGVDSDGNTINVAQNNFFAESKARDKNGNLQVVYHGSPSEFSIFNREMVGKRGTLPSAKLGFYFTSDRQYAQLMGNAGMDSKIYKVYLDIKNPLRVLTTETTSHEYVDEIEAQLRSGQYDGIIDTLDNYVVFSPNQIKSVTNKKPTSSDDIYDTPITPLGANTASEVKTSKVFSNTYNAMFTQAEMDMADMREEDFKYGKVSEKQSLEEAKTRLEQGGVEQSAQDLINNPNWSGIDLDTAMGVLSAYRAEATQTGDYSKVRDWASVIQDHGTQGGQMIQAFAKYSRTPEGLIAQGERNVRKAEKDAPKTVKDTVKKETDAIKKAVEGREDVDSAVEKAMPTKSAKTKKSVADQVKAEIEQGKNNPNAIRDIVKKANGLPVMTDADVQGVLENMQKMDDAVAAYNQAKQAGDKKAMKEADYGRRKYQEKAAQIVANTEAVDNRTRFRSFQRIMMLLNTKSNIINMTANIPMLALENIKDIPGAIFDMGVSLVTGERTTTMLTPAKLAAQVEGMKRAGGEIVKDAKYGVDTSNRAMMGKYSLREGEGPRLTNASPRVWKNSIMNALDTAVGVALRSGDRMFFEGAYDGRLYELQLLGKDASSVEAQQDAVRYALDRVFQNNSKLAQSITGLRNSVNKALSVGDVGLGDLLLPFVQTPANIADKLIDYSGVGGTAKALAQVIGSKKSGEFDQKLFVDRLGRSMTGFGIMALGAALFKAGVLHGGAEDQEQREMMNNAGVEEYSITIGNKSYTLEWMEPAGSLLLMGGAIAKAGIGKEGFVDAVTTAMIAGTDSLFNLSVLQNVASLMGGNGTVGENIVSSILGTSTQFTPSIFNAIAKVIDPVVRDTYDPNPFISTAKKMVARLPWLSTLLPAKVTTSGEEARTMTGNTAGERFAQGWLLPGYYATESDDTVNAEIYRLYETGMKEQILPVAGKSIDGVKFTAEQRRQYQAELGKATHAAAQKVIANYEYGQWDDAKKAERIGKSITKAVSAVNAKWRKQLKTEGY